jgi:four helix bundle protein
MTAATAALLILLQSRMMRLESGEFLGIAIDSHIIERRGAAQLKGLSPGESRVSSFEFSVFSFRRKVNPTARGFPVIVETIGDDDDGADSPRSGVQDYRKLLVWQKAHSLALGVRQITSAFPRTGYGALKDQITRSAESIPFNIAEGCGARSPKEFARYLDISIKSTIELDAQLLLARDYDILESGKWERLFELEVEVRRMLCGLRSKVLGADGQ